MVLFFAATVHAFATTCRPATSPGTASPAWQTYCWIDMTSYSNATVMGVGQTFAITLSDGSIFNFKLTGTASPSTTGLSAIAPPSWTGAAVGNTAFLGIPNKPILYTTAGGTVNLTMSNISITPPSGGTNSGIFKVVVADAESTNSSESLNYSTNGGNWTVIDQVPPISGSSYPTTSNTGTTFTETGVSGTVGAYIVGTQSPSTVDVQLVAGGLQGVMFAVQYATISTNKMIIGGRAKAADQFTYGAKVTSTGTVLLQGVSSGSGNGPFTAAVSTVSSSVPTTVYEQMAPGSVSQLSQYSTSLTCTNGATGSSTSMPTSQAVTSYNFSTIAYGDAISCSFTNTPQVARVSLQKITTGAIGGPFRFSQTNLVSTPANITTSAVGIAAPAAPTAIAVVALGTAVTITEAVDPSFTATSANCTDANAAVTSNPASFGTLSGNTLTIPAANVLAAAQITCTFSNSANPPTISLQKALGGTGRIAASDQFSLSASGSGAPAAVTTTGSGTSVTSSALNFAGSGGSAYTLTEAMAAGSLSALAQYGKTVSCANNFSFGTNVSAIYSLPISFTAVDGDIISCTIINSPGMPSLTIAKSYSTSTTPVVVGQTITYTYTITNDGNVPMSNVKVKDMHGTPTVQISTGAGGINSETLIAPGPLGAAASPDATPNDGVWSTLAPGATVQFIYTHVVTQAEIDHG